jgi:uncharacterized protein involved in exopolysaccharide biosynthesis
MTTQPGARETPAAASRDPGVPTTVTRGPVVAPAPEQFAAPLLSLRLVALMTAIVILAVGTSFLLSAAREPVYGARAEILFTGDTAVSDTAAERRLDTQRVLLGSRAVLEPVSDSTGIAVEDLQEDVAASVIGSSQILELTVADRDPARAEAVAAAVVSSYLTLQSDVAGDTDQADRAAVLTPPYLLDEPLRPRPLQSAAAGALIGIVIAGVTGLVLLQRRAR